MIRGLQTTYYRLPTLLGGNGPAKLSVVRGVPRALSHQSTNEARSFHSAGVLNNADAPDGKEQAPHHRQHIPEPDMEESESFSKEFDARIPSNKAKPTLSDAYQHSGKDAKHPKRPSREELSEEERQKEEMKEQEVKRHNEDMDERHGRASSQITQEGEYKTLDEMEEARFKSEE